MQESLTREMGRHQELKNKLEHLKDRLSQVVVSKGSVEGLLEDEKRNTMLLQDKIRELEVSVSCKINYLLHCSTCIRERENTLCLFLLLYIEHSRGASSDFKKRKRSFLH